MNISLLPFQIKASNQIRDRYLSLLKDEERPHVNKRWAVPYYQALAALTGSGKTPIMADTVAQLRAAMLGEPIVLWMSKAKAVVEQTLANFQSGGKYAHLLEGFLVVGSLQQLSSNTLKDTQIPLLVLTTVGSFNRKDTQEGSLVVHRVAQDRASEPIWSMLRERPADGNLRRPLIIVYDEGHHLSDQQTELILELEPDAILIASATMRTPLRLSRLIQRLRDAGWDDPSLVTSINSKDAVEAGLIKRQVLLGGYASLMESTLNDLLAAFEIVEQTAERLQAGFKPKAIYVCKTNISQEDGLRDNPHQPFIERKAPPILIWRHLVEKGVPPEQIAVYCDLNLDRKHFPPPRDFIHFSGGDDDFAAFTAGRFRHIIFNQSLQEGWDDPECTFAYIDKSMGSTVQVEQVIGRVLRQPGQRHYADMDLNTAQFFIRVDDRQKFREILELVRRKIAAECPEVRLEGYSDRRDREKTRLEPKEVRTAPEIHIQTDIGPLQDEVSQIIDYRNDSGVNVIGKGERLKATQVIGDGSDAKMTSEVISHSNRVMGRWLLRRNIQALYPRVAMAIDWSEERLDARIEVTSAAAANLTEVANRLVSIWLDNSHLVCEEENPYQIAPILVNPQKIELFKNALHSGYSDMNTSELQLAKAIDETGLPWARNQPSGGYSIPLLALGSSYNFFPDFLVWKDDVIFALDPKGEHLISKDAGRKLLNVQSDGLSNKQRVVVRLITIGKWDNTEVKKSNTGYTVWYLSSAGQVKGRHTASLEKTIELSLQNLK